MSVLKPAEKLKEEIKFLTTIMSYCIALGTSAIVASFGRYNATYSNVKDIDFILITLSFGVGMIFFLLASRVYLIIDKLIK